MLGSASSDADEAESAYRDALSAAEALERASASGRRPQPARAALAVLLQARGAHAEAVLHLDIQLSRARNAIGQVR